MEALSLLQQQSHQYLYDRTIPIHSWHETANHDQSDEAKESCDGISLHHSDGHCFLAERSGSGDGERKALLTRQTAFEPLPASVLFGL
ncbi:MAG: hypothetical protein JNM99_22900 [Verrucomicrobiaceae bacterium]|nr:hypothetical protein [Verrucomicrobiaceae bacterium]